MTTTLPIYVLPTILWCLVLLSMDAIVLSFLIISHKQSCSSFIIVMLYLYSPCICEVWDSQCVILWLILNHDSMKCTDRSVSYATWIKSSCLLDFLLIFMVFHSSQIEVRGLKLEDGWLLDYSSFLVFKLHSIQTFERQGEKKVLSRRPCAFLPCDFVH